ncbi:hypothetical protein [Methylobacterium sp. JK268]
MPIPVDQTLVPGDVLLVRVKFDFVDARDPDAIFGSIVGSDAAVHLTRAVADLVETVIAVGDEVRAIEARPSDSPAIRPYGVVLGLSKGRAWVEWPLGESTEPVATLQRIRTREQVEAFEPRPGESPRTAEAAAADPLPAAAE